MEESNEVTEEPTLPTYEPLAPQSVALPEGWYCYFDDTQQAYYYYNEADGSSQWHHPSSTDDPYTLYEDDYVEEGNAMAQKVADMLQLSQQDEVGIAAYTPYTYDAYNEKNNDFAISSDYYVNERVNLNARPSNEEKLVRNKDYMALARAYKYQRPYSDPQYKAICLLCHKNECTDVFFPCQHRCVCHNCIISESICDELTYLKQGDKGDGYFMCSLCAEVIKKILPSEHGLEVQKYWDWVYEERVQMPRDFMRTFKHSAAIIEAVYMNDAHRKKGDAGSGACAIS